jgi:hypothetical protein
MSKGSKIQRRVNGGLAIYYGIGSMLTAIGSVIALIVRLFKIWSGTAELSWAILILLLVFAAITGFVGYLLLRVGYEEIEG